MLLAVIAGGVLAAAFTELLSALRQVTFPTLVLGWGVALAGATLLVARRLPMRATLALRSFPALRPGLDVAMAGFVVVVVVLTGVLAVSTVPTTWDSMTYHLARVAHWAQNHTVAFFPTHIIRQLYQPPWAEFAMLHLFVLAGGDRLVNLVQWASMVGSLVGVSLIARQLGAGARGQLLSAFVCVTIPMGVMQASTTQNDYAAAVWLVCLAHALLALGSRPGLVPTLGAGASLGLAALTKGTAYIFAAPFLLGFLLGGRDRSAARKLAQALLIVACALALNGPQYWRNVTLFGAPLGPGKEGADYTYRNQELSASILASNVLRNLGVHLGTPWPAANAMVERAIEAAHRAIGIAVDDPRSTWPGTRFEITSPVAHEDLAGNGLHLLLIAVAAVIAWRPRSGGRLKTYAACLVLAFLLFSLLLRWQPWHSRLELPLFVLAAPLVGVVFERLNPRLLVVVLLALAGSCWYFLARAEPWSLVGRAATLATPLAEQRMASAGPAYVGATRFVASTGCLQVGSVLGGDDPEYFLRGLLADAGWRGRLEPVLVDNVSARLSGGENASLQPCAIVRVTAAPRGAGLILGEQHYRPAWSEGTVQVLVPTLIPESLVATGPPVARLLLERARFRSGDRVTVGVEAWNPPGGVPADLYVGVLLPDGQSVFAGPSGLLGAAVSPADGGGFPRVSPATPGFAVRAPTFLEFTVPAGVAPGTYRFFARLVRRRTPREESARLEDILASDVRDVVFSP